MLEQCNEYNISEDGLLLPNPKLIEFHLNHTNVSKGSCNPRLIVTHYTAGPSLKSAVRSLTDPRRKASAHFIIDQYGKIAQLVSTTQESWHAGKSAWDDDDGVPYTHINNISIGIEFVNAGRLLKSTFPGGVLYRTWWGEEIHEDWIYDDGKFGWEVYSPEQLESGLALTAAILERHPGITNIVGHSDICAPPGRKIDPGPAFPMEKFSNLIEDRSV